MRASRESRLAKVEQRTDPERHMVVLRVVYASGEEAPVAGPVYRYWWDGHGNFWHMEGGQDADDIPDAVTGG